MSVEGSGYQEPIKEQIKQEPNRLVKMTQEWTERLGFDINLVGEERLNEIPDGAGVIIATSHMSDHDVLLTIAALGKHFGGLKVAEQSSHFDIKREAPMYFARMLAGKDNSFKVEVAGAGKERRGVFDPENFAPMKEFLDEGKPLVIASYLDPQYAGKKWELSEKVGNGAAYLSQITENSVILPVAVDIKTEPFGMGDMDTKKMIGKPNLKKMRAEAKDVDVIIGEPITPDKIQDIGDLSEVLLKRKNGEEITENDRKRFRKVKNELKHKSREVISAIASLLPESQRGPWNKSESPDLN